MSTSSILMNKLRINEYLFLIIERFRNLEAI